MSLRRARSEITPEEFRSWRAFDRIEPIGFVRDDLRAARAAQGIANALRHEKEPFEIDRFLLNFEPREPKKINVDDLKAGLLMYAKACGAKEVK
jgi:hypothetical protein